MDEREFRNLLISDCHLDPEKPLLVGFSGGPDSLYLLHRLWGMGCRVIAAHLDHGLRPSSQREAEFATQLCQGWGVRSIVQKVDVREYAERQKISIEEAAREERYRFLFSTAEKTGAQAVLVAHHADDQVETLLMHFLRGSGTSGLAGMRLVMCPTPWSKTIPLVRPLLQIWRAEIEAYCHDHDLNPIRDESNTDTTLFRNRIRAELIPELLTYNPGIKERLLRTADVIAGDDACLQEQTEQTWRECLKNYTNDFLVLDRTGILHLHPALQRRLVRKGIGELNATLRDIDFEVIQRAVDFIQKPGRTNKVDLMAGLEAFLCFRNEVIFARRDAQFDQIWPQMHEEEISLPVPGEVLVGGGWRLSSVVLRDLKPTGDEWICRLDADNITGPLRLRKLRPGDRFEPLGMDGKTVKMGDFWTEAGLPVKARQAWPLLVDDNRILWVPGFRLSHAVRIKPETTHAIHLRLHKE